ncbi:PaaI family thioesterase [Nocardioides panacisoli]|uniref:Thioesterase domain-containing protein n=1 Tax=Nocardioides panacisoli TaxID=627624 RepID=A0ABP7I0L6_9ACTN
MSDVAVWQQPVMGETLPRAALALPGLETLGLLTRGRVAPPPVSYLTGMNLVEVGPGTARFDMPVTGWLAGPYGRPYLGVLAILADGPLGCAIHTVLPAGQGYTTTELSLSLVRPVPTEGTLVATARVIYAGRSTALSDAEVTTDDGRLIAHCTTRCSVFPAPPAAEPLGEHPVRDVSLPADAPFRLPVRGLVVPDEVWATRSGLEVLGAHASGELAPPPIGELLGLGPVAAADGATTFTLPAHGWLAQPLGLVEGGITACLADSAMSASVQTTVADGRAYAPVDLRVNFLRPVMPDGRTLTATAEVVHRSRSMAYTRADVVNADGKVVATASGTALYR